MTVTDFPVRSEGHLRTAGRVAQFTFLGATNLTGVPAETTSYRDDSVIPIAIELNSIIDVEDREVLSFMCSAGCADVFYIGCRPTGLSNCAAILSHEENGFEAVL